MRTRSEVAGHRDRAMAQLDEAVTEALALLGLPRGPIGRLRPCRLQASLGIRRRCDIEIGMTTMCAIAVWNGAPTPRSGTWGTKVHPRPPPFC